MSISAYNPLERSAGHLGQNSGQDGAGAVSDAFSLKLLYPYPFASSAQTVGRRLNLSAANRSAITAAAIERPHYASLMQHNTQDNPTLERGRAAA